MCHPVDELELSMIPPGLQDKMLDATRQMLRAGNTVAIDRDGVLTGSSTDSLHALWYLRGQDVDQETVRNIMDHLEPLTTDVGYSTASIHQRGTYHNDVIWSFEQVGTDMGLLCDPTSAGLPACSCNQVWTQSSNRGALSSCHCLNCCIYPGN